MPSRSEPARSALTCRASIAAAMLAPFLAGPAGAAGQGEQVRGIFCNTVDQLDAVLDDAARGIPLSAAVEARNRDAIVCTLVDLLFYVVADPVIVGESGALGFGAKYRARLVGVLVGGVLRPVEPPVVAFFVTPGRIAAVRESQT